MRKETFFALNRILLLIVVIGSLVIPMNIMPQYIINPVQVHRFNQNGNKLQDFFHAEKIDLSDNATIVQSGKRFVPSIQQILLLGYLLGSLITFIILVNSLFPIILLYRKTQAKQMDGYKLLIFDNDISAFSLGHLVFISQGDYQNHRNEIMTHELEHIRLNHTYDLLFLESVKIIFWFNPIIHLIIRDMKDVHEFQADSNTIKKGIDATQYQLLMIQKGVGSQKFALANSFNQFQIKKRITMMNKQKNRKISIWKAVTFLPILAILTMAFGNPEKAPNNKVSSSESAINPKANLVEVREHKLYVTSDDPNNQITFNARLCSEIYDKGCKVIEGQKTPFEISIKANKVSMLLKKTGGSANVVYRLKDSQGETTALWPITVVVINGDYSDTFGMPN
jgi:hypothetical protein